MNNEVKFTFSIPEATNCPAADVGGKSDPYVSVKMGKLYNFKTDVVKSNLNPKWRNSSFTIVSKDPSNDVVDLILYDWDRNSSDDELARLSVPVSRILNGDVDEWMEMKVTHQVGGFKLSSFLSKYDRSRPTKIQIKMSRIGVHNTAYDPNVTSGPSIDHNPPPPQQQYHQASYNKEPSYYCTQQNFPPTTIYYGPSTTLLN
eukprot:TRINITY_DN28594_c0_g1_i1.p1 TRINITY_DN28594_c0_g1~~TRINITY_DN28594_c0_g1_i1.p1  ORF type:complete len:209 (-),score=38.98 TRINITY_DN28594_c0_g1_i1:95-700(-)